MSSPTPPEMNPTGAEAGGETPAFTAEQLVLIDGMIAARLGSRSGSLPGTSGSRSGAGSLPGTSGSRSGAGSLPGTSSLEHSAARAGADPLTTAASSSGESSPFGLVYICLQAVSRTRHEGPRGYYRIDPFWVAEGPASGKGRWLPSDSGEPDVSAPAALGRARCPVPGRPKH